VGSAPPHAQYDSIMTFIEGWKFIKFSFRPRRCDSIVVGAMRLLWLNPPRSIAYARSAIELTTSLNIFSVKTLIVSEPSAERAVGRVDNDLALRALDR
jgi:hypothetical protein